MPLTHWVEDVFTVASQGGEDHAVAAGHDRAGAAAGTHGRDDLRHLPWFLAGLLAITAVIEGAFLVRRRRRATA